MIISPTLNYARKINVTIHRFILTAESTSGSYIASLINPHKVSDMSITCSDKTLTWSHFVEHRGNKSVVYEIPAQYADAFNLYVKALQIGFPDA